MKLTIDTDNDALHVERDDTTSTLELFSEEAMELISRQWLRVGWQMKYTYTFTWLGRPIIQLPEDLVRTQEVIYSLRPDVIVETGIAHGGSLVFYASLCRLMGKGRVIGIDVEIRPHNRKAIEAHELVDLIALVEGDSVSPDVVSTVEKLVGSAATVLVFLDSCHTKQHVSAELESYHSLVTPGSYIVATDGIMEWVCDVPRGDPSWLTDNPSAAALEFVKSHPEFVIEQPPWPFGESPLEHNITHWPNAWLKRVA